MSRRPPGATNLLIAAVWVSSACSFDVSRLRAHPYADGGPGLDLSVVATYPGNDSGQQEVFSAGKDVALGDLADDGGGFDLGVGIAVDGSVEAGGAASGTGGSGGLDAGDGPFSQPAEVTDSGAAKDVGGAMDGNAGGANGSGGVVGSDGAIGAGGAVGLDGDVGSDSPVESIGEIGSGGAAGTGGATGAGGAWSTGGSAGLGGATGSGGATSANGACTSYTNLGTLTGSTEYTAVPAAATCFKFMITPASDQLHGFQMANCETRRVTINGTDSGCTPATACHVSLLVPASADGYWYIQFSAGTTASCSSTWWWSP